MPAANRITTTVDNSQAYRELAKLRNEVGLVNESFGRLQAVVAGGALGAFITNTLNATARVAELARSTGLTGQSIAAFQLAVRDAGGTMDQAGDAVASLVKKIGEARSGSTEAVNAFGAIGISMTDLANLDEQQLFQRTIQGLKNIPDLATRNAAAIKLMEEAVKRVDFGQINLGQYSSQAATLATTGETVRQTQINMAQALDEVKVSLVAALTPLAELARDLTSNREAIRAFVQGAIEIGKTVAVFFALTKGVRMVSDALALFVTNKRGVIAAITEGNPVFRALRGSLDEASEGFRILRRNATLDWRTNQKTLKEYANTLLTLNVDKVIGVFRQLQDIKFDPRKFGEVDFAKLGEAASGFAKNIKNITFAFSKLLPIIGQAVVAFELLDTGIQMLTGRNLADYFRDLGDSVEAFVTQRAPRLAGWINAIGASIRDLFGIEPKGADKEQQAFIDRMNRSVEAVALLRRNQKQKADADAKQLSVQQQQSAAIQQQVVAYQAQIRATRDSFQSQTAMISMNERQRLLTELNTAALEQYRQKLADVDQQIAKARAAPAGSAEQQSLKGLLGLREKITASYRQQQRDNQALVNARVKEIEAERAFQFLQQRGIENRNEANRLMGEAATIGMGPLQRSLIQVEQQANDAAQAAIDLAEAARRGPLTAAERTTYFEEALKNINLVRDGLVAAENQAQRVQFRDFQIQQARDLVDQLEQLRFAAGNVGLGELAQQYREVDRASYQSALTAIRAEQDRRRVTKLSEEEQQRFFDTAMAGNQQLKEQLRANWEASRTFSAGWATAYAEFKDMSTNAANVGRAAFESLRRWGEDFTNTLVDYFRTGQLEISKLVQNILADIARLTIQQTITTPIANALASGLSAGFGRFGTAAPSAAGAPFQAPAGTGLGLRAPAGGATTFGAFANGGDAVAGRSYVVGERGREIFTPAVAGRVSPITQPQAPVLNLTVNVDARSDVAAVRQAVRESSYIAQAEMARSMRTGQSR